MLLLLFCLIPLVKSIPIDNGVIGDPEIQCGSESIGISANTKNNFEGQVFVKGLYHQEGCAKLGGGSRTAFLILPFDSCNVQRLRSTNPRGVFVSVTVIISFHQKFLTKIDKAYRIQCFYMEADKTVSADLEVSPLTTSLQTQNVPMPVCRYDILDGGPTGEPIKYVLVGQQIYHKWTCDTDTTDVFCMIVHTCFVDDGSGDKVDLVDGQGCAVDKYLLRNLEYPMDLMAGQESHAFKYADRVNLYFQCQIAISVKEPGEDCPRPKCSDNRLRYKREQSVTSVDVAYNLDALPLEENPETLDLDLLRNSDRLPGSDEVCMSNAGFGSLIIVTTLLLAISLTVTLVCLWKRRDVIAQQKMRIHSTYYYGYY